MKKFLIILTFFISTIFVIDNVKAEEYIYDIPDGLIPVFENYTFDTWSTASESSNYNKFKKQIDDVLNKKTDISCVNTIVDNYENYIFIYNNGNNMAIFWNGDDYEARFGGGYGSYWSGGKKHTGPKIGLYNSISTGNEKVIYLGSDGEYVCSNNYVWSDKQATSTTPLLSYTLQGSNVPSDIINNYNNGYFPTVYTNQDIKVGNYYDGKTTSDFGLSVSYAYDSFTLNGKTYNVGDVIIPRNDISTPTITITKENQTTVTIENETYISSVTLNIEFSMIDNEKYLYMYKYGINSDWATITLTQSNSFPLTFNYNDTLYVQVLDRETTEFVSSSTFTVTSINYNFKPFVDVVEKIPTGCSFYKNGKNYILCKELNIIAKNLEDGNYIASYSYDLTDWTNFENTNLTINENKTVYFRIINYLTNEVSYTSTYTVSSIDDTSELGVFNTYSSTYDKDTSFITAYINIYNLLEPVQDNYKIYYSTNSTSFTDITLLLNDMTNYYQYEINNINENKTIYFKITDLNDNILYTSTYTINYQAQATENSNFFTNFRTNFHGLSDIISTPLYSIKKLNNGVCSPLKIPIPYTNKNISLPCMTTVYENNIPGIFNIWQIVTNGIISYYIILDLFRIVKSFKEPEEDKIEVVDL